jgi:hypothetical protein
MENLTKNEVAGTLCRTVLDNVGFWKTFQICMHNLGKCERLEGKEFFIPNLRFAEFGHGKIKDGSKIISDKN